MHAEVLTNFPSQRMGQFTSQSRTCAPIPDLPRTHSAVPPARYRQREFSGEQAVTRLTLQKSNLMWPKAFLDMNIVAEKAKNGDKSACQPVFAFEA